MGVRVPPRLPKKGTIMRVNEITIANIIVFVGMVIMATASCVPQPPPKDMAQSPGDPISTIVAREYTVRLSSGRPLKTVWRFEIENDTCTVFDGARDYSMSCARTIR